MCERGLERINDGRFIMLIWLTPRLVSPSPVSVADLQTGRLTFRLQGSPPSQLLDLLWPADEELEADLFQLPPWPPSLTSCLKVT